MESFTPSNLKISSGFVCDYRTAKGNNLFNAESKQVDCLTFDSKNYVPFLKAHDFSIISPESVYAAVEVKSDLTFYKTVKTKNPKVPDDKYPLGGDWQDAYRWNGTLVDALSNIQSISNVCKGINSPIFSGILAYSAFFDVRNLYHALETMNYNSS